MSAAVVTAIDTQFNDSTAAIRRYQDGYRVADTVVTFGQTVKLGGIFVGGVTFVAGLVEFILNPAEHHGFAVIFSFADCLRPLATVEQVGGSWLGFVCQPCATASGHRAATSGGTVL